MDMKDKKMTIIGDTDPVNVVSKLRKLCHAEIIAIGPAKEEKKEERKKEEEKKEEKKKEEPKKKDTKDELADLMKAYETYYNQTKQPYPYHYYRSVEAGSPSGCAIC